MQARAVSINQWAYIKSMVEKFRLTGAKPVNMPMEPGAQFSVDQSPSSLSQMVKMCDVPYSEAISSVLWPVVVLRPDAAYAVGVLSQFIQNPVPAHWEQQKTSGLPLEDKPKVISKGSAMQTGQVRNTAIPSPGTCSIMASEQCLGVPRSRALYCCRAPRQST